MKTNFKTKPQTLVLVIYLLAFFLMTWSLKAEADAKHLINPEIMIKTNMGNIKVKLNSEKAPITTENFLKYVEKKHYNGTVFHRVIENFMIQGGGYLPDMSEKDTMTPIKNEAKNGLSNLRGTIAMARTNEVDSATSQFFINVVDNQRLDYYDDKHYGYAVFGEVTDGMNVVDKIRHVKTALKGEHSNVPAKPVVINSISLIKPPATKTTKSKK